jgi:glycosyltransferase involved in cell wall biosynthesis
MLEYMASQKPIVTTDVGIRDFITHEETGLIVEPNDALALSQAICRLLNNRNLAQQLAQNARNYVTCNLREEMMVDKFEDLLGTLASSRSH